MEERRLSDPPRDEETLEEMLSRPTPETVEAMGQLEGDVVLLGVSGKIGPSLARMVVRASEAAGKRRRVIGVARFSEGELRKQLEAWGVETIACDLLDVGQVWKIPTAANVIFLAGRKFGRAGTEPLTWATNTASPLLVRGILRGARRLVAFSTGCVYPLVGVDSAGSRESDPPEPVGEYAWSCLGRERMFEFICEQDGIPTLLLRLNYSHALRYGVMTDIAVAIKRGEEVDVTVEAFNALWQGDVNNWTLRSLVYAAIPAAKLNLAGPEKLWVREVATEMARQLGREVKWKGVPSGVAYLSDARRAMELFGPPSLSAEWVMRATIEWVRLGLPVLGKPTHFQVTDGQFLDEPQEDRLP